MASVETTLDGPVQTGESVVLAVPGLRHGDIEVGTGVTTVGGSVQSEVTYAVDYAGETIEVRNDSAYPWAAGAQLEVSWSGVSLEATVQDHEGRIAVLEANLGVTDGSDAAPGQIGEYLNIDNIIGVVPTANVPTQICSLSLPPGCWEIWGACDFTIAGTVVDTRGPPVQPNQLAASISLHPNGLPTQNDLIVGTGVMNLIYSPLSSGQRQVLITGQCRSNSVDEISLYLVAAVGSSNANVKGYMSARRMR